MALGHQVSRRATGPAGYLYADAYSRIPLRMPMTDIMIVRPLKMPLNT